MACEKSAGRTALTALAPEAHYLAAGTMSGAVGQPSSASTLKIYSLHFHSVSPNAQFLAEISSPDRFNRICWSRPAAAEHPSFSLGLLAGGLSDGSVALWNPLKFLSLEGPMEDKLVARLEKHSGAVTGMEFSMLEPNWLASGDNKGEIRIWDVRKPRKPEAIMQLKNVGLTAQSEMTCLNWNPNGKDIVASTYSNGITVVWDLRNQKPSTSFKNSDGRRCSVMQWNPDMSTNLAVASDDDMFPSLRVWDMRKPNAAVQEMMGHSKGVITMSWCPYDGSFLLSCGKDNRIICWDTDSGKIISELPASLKDNFDIHWYRETPVFVAASSVDGEIGVHNLEFSGFYSAVDSPVGASGKSSLARPRARAPKWLKCPQHSATSEVHANKLVEESVDETLKELREQIGTSKDEKNVKCAKDFVEKYYNTFNKRPSLLHELYGEESTLNWPNSDGEMTKISGAEALKNLFSSKTEVCKDFVACTISVQASQTACLLAVATGRFTDSHGKLSKFSQSFILKIGENGELSISNDVMNFYGSHQNVCVIYDDDMKNHCGNADEQPARLSNIMSRFSDYGLLQRVVIERPAPVKDDEILAVHKEGYLEFIKDLPISAQKKKDYRKFFCAKNISFSDGTLKAVLLSAGSVVQACKLVAAGRYDHAFAVVRPPGHHATASLADGFCFLNNIAIGAKELIRYYHMKKILIIDFDVHHGDGTQSIFFEDDRVLFFSTHRGGLGFYPHSESGNPENIGTGKGKGYNINVCLPAKFGDDDLLAALEYVLLPVAKEFSPDMILLSAGFDAAKGDPVGHCNVMPQCFGTAIDMIKKIPCKRGLVLALEGGYNLAALAESAASCLKSLLGDRDDLVTIENYRPLKDTWAAITETRKHLSPHWHVLSPEIPQEVLDRNSTEAPSVIAPGAALTPPAAGGRQNRRAPKRATKSKDPGKNMDSQLSH